MLKVLSTKAAQDIKLPAIQTARHPYLLANAETIGPMTMNVKKKCNLIINPRFVPFHLIITFVWLSKNCLPALK